MTYEYVCTACGHAWEAEQSISAAALTDCPSCQEKTAKRQVSGGAGFILKGGGWYSDLYSSAPKKPSGDSAPAAEAGTGASKEAGAAAPAAVKAKSDGSSGSGSSGSSSSGSGSSGGSSGGTGTPAAGGGKPSGASAA